MNGHFLAAFLSVNIHLSNTRLRQLNRVAQLTFVVINVALRCADVSVTGKCLNNTYVDALEGRLLKRITDKSVCYRHTSERVHSTIFTGVLTLRSVFQCKWLTP